MKVTEFTIEESKVSKGLMILVVHAEDGSKWVVSGDAHITTRLAPYEQCWDAIGEEAHRKLTNPARP